MIETPGGALTNLESLTVIIKNPNPDSREGAIRNEDLESICNLRRVKFLQLSTSPYLTDEGLAPLASMKGLERVFVGGPNVTDRGLAHFSGLTSIWQLGITGDFTDQGLRQLDDLTRMQYLNINSARGVSPQAQQHIRGTLPDLVDFQVR